MTPPTVVDVVPSARPTTTRISNRYYLVPPSIWDWFQRIVIVLIIVHACFTLSAWLPVQHQRAIGQSLHNAYRVSYPAGIRAPLLTAEATTIQKNACLLHTALRAYTETLSSVQVSHRVTLTEMEATSLLFNIHKHAHNATSLVQPFCSPPSLISQSFTTSQALFSERLRLRLASSLSRMYESYLSYSHAALGLHTITLQRALRTNISCDFWTDTDVAGLSAIRFGMRLRETAKDALREFARGLEYKEHLDALFAKGVSMRYTPQTEKVSMKIQTKQGSASIEFAEWMAHTSALESEAASVYTALRTGLRQYERRFAAISWIAAEHAAALRCDEIEMSTEQRTRRERLTSIVFGGAASIGEHGGSRDIEGHYGNPNSVMHQSVDGQMVRNRAWTFRVQGVQFSGTDIESAARWMMRSVLGEDIESGSSDARP